MVCTTLCWRKGDSNRWSHLRRKRSSERSTLLAAHRVRKIGSGPGRPTGTNPVSSASESASIWVFDRPSDRFADNAARVANCEASDALVAVWTRTLSKMEMFDRPAAPHPPDAGARR